MYASKIFETRAKINSTLDFLLLNKSTLTLLPAIYIGFSEIYKIENEIKLTTLRLAKLRPSKYNTSERQNFYTLLRVCAKFF